MKITAVSAALATAGSDAVKRAAILALATELDEYNNAGCPLGLDPGD
jgi:hypothetical protein